jgi:FtsP/CotA-like multicopper oxidase with cupredoxin domain
LFNEANTSQGVEMTTKQNVHVNIDQFQTETSGLPVSGDTQVVALSAGDTFDLRIAPVTKRIGGVSVRMLAYNGSIPGPVLKVRQGSEVAVQVINHGDLEATVHWHGLLVENQYDGTHETQVPMAIGAGTTYRLRFLHPGIYWYHPHVREDYGQELGLYGNILVVPTDSDYWPPVNREVVLTLDDILIEDGKVAPFSRSETTHVAMGRFGNVMLTNGETNLSLTAKAAEVVRFYLTNTANTRVFNVGIQGARMKLLGGDSGRVEVEQFVDQVILAPSERCVVDVLFDKPGPVLLEHHSPDRRYKLATIDVTTDPAEPSFLQQHRNLRRNPDMAAERRRVAPYLDTPPDKTLAFVAEMNLVNEESDGATVYTCPMHPEIVGEKGSRCSKCNMKLMPSPGVGKGTEHHAMNHDAAAESHDGIEWEDLMVEINRITTPANMHWKLVDRETNADNHAIDWRFKVGDQVKIRLVNEPESDHPMHHPFHIHGAGRFLVLSRDGVVEPNLTWKDTVLVRAGQTVDILLDITNPGIWMAHCHIAEHHESGMMFSFNVTPRDEAKTGMVINSHSLRLAATLLSGGTILSFLSGILHPAREYANNHAAVFGEYANSSHWATIHLGQFAGMAAILFGLIALGAALDVRAGLSAWIRRFGTTSAAVALGLYAILQAVDGVALKQAVNAWAAAPEAEKLVRFANAETVRWLEWGIRSYQSFMFGLALVLFATSITRRARGFRTIGFLMGLSGVAYFVQGVVLGSEGFSTTNSFPTLLANLWCRYGVRGF